MKITVDQAREYWAHKSQHYMGARPDNLPEIGVEYWAKGPICVAFHRAPWPGCWMVHYGAKPNGWGRLVDPAKEILGTFFREKGAVRIIGWTAESNRAALAFARRVGFVVDGEFQTPSGKVVMQGWIP